MLHFVCDFVEASQTQQRNNMGIGEASQIEQRNNMGIESFRVCSQKGIAMPIFVICFARRAGWSTRCSRRSTDSCCLSCLQQNLQKKSRASVFVCLFDPYSVLFDIVCFDSESFRWFLLARWMQKMLLHWNAWHAEPAAAAERFVHQTPILGRRDDFDKLFGYDVYRLHSKLHFMDVYGPYTVLYCIFLSLYLTLRKSWRFLTRCAGYKLWPERNSTCFLTL